jgi:hypothetical protein
MDDTTVDLIAACAHRQHWRRVDRSSVKPLQQTFGAIRGSAR